ncbi:MAG: hypothetical protein EAZ08_13875 [Cytophagales bacterium]|nr:MAG: hypothetical protein EAZ08_13875 [Cytophagales bacterium]
MSNYRYPGAFPFQTYDQHIFFGREKDVERFITLLNVEKLIVMYAKSGIGKSSLVNAGVMPKLKNLPRYERNLRIRLLSYNADSSTHIASSPLQTLIGELDSQEHQNFLANIEMNNSLWLSLKMMQANATHKKGAVVLFFDQFEEFFDYPKEQQIEFKQAIAEILRSSPPDRIEKAAQEQKGLTEEQIEFLFTPLEVKIVFLIRSDRMSYLDSMKDYIPSILSTTFEIRPLDKEQASSAIEEPAKKIGSFQIPTFRYTKESKEHILSFISDEKGQYEPYQIQLICSRLERKILKENSFTADTLIQKEYIGDLNALIEGVYKDAIDDLPEMFQKKSRILIESRLLKNGKRKSLDQDECELPLEVLEQLEDSRILRREVNHLGNATYEIAHDTFIEPIERLRKEREEKEKEEGEQKKIQQELEKAKQEAERYKLQRNRERKRTAVLAFMGVLSIAFAVWALWEKRQGEQAQAKFYTTQFELYSSNGDVASMAIEYKSAVNFYNSALKISGQDSAKIAEVKKKKKQAEINVKNEPLFQKLIGEGHSLAKKEELNEALVKYEQALKLDYNIALANKYIIDAKEDIERSFKKYMEMAENNKDRGEIRYYKEYLEKAKKLKPNDERLKQFEK